MPACSACDDLFQKRWGRLRGYCRSLLTIKSDDEAAAQDSCLEYNGQCGMGTLPPGHPPRWLFGIARFVCLARNRQVTRRGEQHLIHDEEARSETEFVLVDLDAEAMLQAVMSAVDQRALLVLMRIRGEGLRPKDLTGELGVVNDHVQRLFRGALKSVIQALQTAGWNREHIVEFLNRFWLLDEWEWRVLWRAFGEQHMSHEDIAASLSLPAKEVAAAHESGLNKLRSVAY